MAGSPRPATGQFNHRPTRDPLGVELRDSDLRIRKAYLLAILLLPLRSPALEWLVFGDPREVRFSSIPVFILFRSSSYRLSYFLGSHGFWECDGGVRCVSRSEESRWALE